MRRIPDHVAVRIQVLPVTAYRKIAMKMHFNDNALTGKCKNWIDQSVHFFSSVFSTGFTITESNML